MTELDGSHQTQYGAPKQPLVPDERLVLCIKGISSGTRAVVLPHTLSDVMHHPSESNKALVPDEMLDAFTYSPE
uniref:Uncharacterized protein n=1 Tax=Moniliophthora roreri TaxID=221103 RepID=A0A0W0GDN2_MONRR